MTDFVEQHAVYRENAWPGMVDVLAGQLGVSAGSLNALAVGWKITDNAWIFPERTADGTVVGLLRRFDNGKKRCEKDSKRALIFAPVPATSGYDASRQSWTRVTEADPCPICGKTKWCGIDGNVSPPRFVRCMKQAEGAVHTCASGGYIHELVPGTFQTPTAGNSVLASSSLPVLVVEGATDTAAAMDLGFTAVGRPSAEGGLSELIRLLRGRTVAVIGENDAGAGRAGMEQAFEALKSGCTEVYKVMPPPDVKDLREWVRKYDLDTDSLRAAIKDGSQDSAGNMLESKAPLAVAERWLRETQMQSGDLILRKWHGAWYRFGMSSAYESVQEDDGIRGPLYSFLQDKTYMKFNAKGEATVEQFEPTRAKISDIVDALNMSCPVLAEPPCWLDGRTTPKPKDIIVFTNGILDVTKFLSGETQLQEPTPLLFHFSAMPYAFDENASCPMWLKFLRDIFGNDHERVNLLQEWFGYNLVADTSMEKMMLMVGRPGSGKGTTLEVLQAMLGHGQCAKSSFKDLCSDHGLQPLMGKLAIILPDAHVPRQVDATQALEKIKSITGRDGVTINPKYLPQIPDHQLTGRFTIAVNELPELPDHARSLERRLLMLHYPLTFEGREDRTLKDRLPTEAPGVALWALEGLKRLRENDRFTLPSSSIPVIEEFRRFLTPIAEFMDECCDIKPDVWVPKGQIYDCWAIWARAHGLRPGVRSRFGQRLLAQNPAFSPQRKIICGDRVSVYEGIGLTANAKDKYLAGER